MADPYSKQEIEGLRSPAVSWQYLDARRIVATWDALKAEVERWKDIADAHRQGEENIAARAAETREAWRGALKERDTLRQQVAEQQAAIERLLWLSDGWVGRKETRDEMRRLATQHDGRALREVRAEAVDGSIKVEHHCGRYALMVNGHGIVIEGDVCRSDKMTQRTWTRDMLRQVVRDNPHRQPQADHPTTTATDEEIQQAADDEYFIAEAARMNGATMKGKPLSEHEGAGKAADDLSGADLRGADLRGADLSGADLYSADLRGAELGADLGVWERGPDGFAQRRKR